MENDQVTVQWLNLIHTSPNFVIRIGKSDESANVLSPSLIPKDDGEYWVSGETILNNGIKVSSVFRVDTGSGGSLIGVYWIIGGSWWDFQERPGVFEALSIDESEAFPFEWKFSVQLEEDIYH